MSVLSDLERELLRAAARPVRRRLWPTGRAGLLLTTGVVVTGGVATAAGLGLVGPQPDRPESFDQAISTEVTGRAVDDGTLLPIRAADPDGGPPWGMRVTRTARGAACVQVGRVVQGQLVYLGREGAYDNDGRAHVVPVGRDLCVPTDVHGTPLLRARTATSTTAGVGRCADRQTRAQRDRTERSNVARRNRDFPNLPPVTFRPATDAEWKAIEAVMCSPGSLRLMRWGFAGPHARTVELTGERSSGSPQRARLPSAGPGAWLFVRRLPDRPADRVAALRSPGVVSATFGRTGPVAITGPDKVRSLPGIVRPERDQRPGPLDVRITEPRTATDPVTVSFRAPVDALRYPNSYLGYVETVKDRDPAATRCRRAPVTASYRPDVPRATNVRKGQRVTLTIRPPKKFRDRPAAWCPGPHRLRVGQLGVSSRGARDLVSDIFMIDR